MKKSQKEGKEKRKRLVLLIKLDLAAKDLDSLFTLKDFLVLKLNDLVLKTNDLVLLLEFLVLDASDLLQKVGVDQLVMKGLKGGQRVVKGMVKTAVGDFFLFFGLIFEIFEIKIFIFFQIFFNLLLFLPRALCGRLCDACECC